MVVYGCFGIFFDTVVGGVTEYSTGVLLGGFGHTKSPSSRQLPLEMPET